MEPNWKAHAHRLREAQSIKQDVATDTFSCIHSNTHPNEEEFINFRQLILYQTSDFDCAMTESNEKEKTNKSCVIRSIWLSLFLSFSSETKRKEKSKLTRVYISIKNKNDNKYYLLFSFQFMKREKAANRKKVGKENMF